EGRILPCDGEEVGAGVVLGAVEIEQDARDERVSRPDLEDAEAAQGAPLTSEFLLEELEASLGVSDRVLIPRRAVFNPAAEIVFREGLRALERCVDDALEIRPFDEPLGNPAVEPFPLLLGCELEQESVESVACVGVGTILREGALQKEIRTQSALEEG